MRLYHKLDAYPCFYHKSDILTLCPTLNPTVIIAITTYDNFSNRINIISADTYNDIFQEGPMQNNPLKRFSPSSLLSRFRINESDLEGLTPEEIKSIKQKRDRKLTLITIGASFCIIIIATLIVILISTLGPDEAINATTENSVNMGDLFGAVGDAMN
jgi:hypothetical protein